MPNIHPAQTWIVIPAFNEAKYVGQVLTQVKKYSQHIICVDDGSKDNTAAIAAKYTSHTLRHTVNLGKGAALKTGCEYAFNTKHASAVIILDADAQHKPKMIPFFLRQLSRVDVVFGVRQRDTSMPFLRSFGNQFASFLICCLFGVYIPDIPSGYKGFTAKAYQQLKWEATDYTVEMEIAARVARYRLRFGIVPIETIYYDLDRGMTTLDLLSIFGKVINWRLSL